MRDTVRVKISSDAAGAIALTPVVVQEMPLAELLDHMVGVWGKDQARIRQALQRGSLVAGASRLRWEGWEADEAEVVAALARFPDPEPGRPLQLDRCVAIVLRSGAQQIQVPRDAAAKRRLFHRSSFWDAVAPLASEAAYAGYCYREKADVYRTSVSRTALVTLREAAERISYATLARQLNLLAIDAIEFHVPR